MAQAFPYTYYACNCDSNASGSTRASQILAEADEEGRNFDPRNPRSNYALYPLEHLLYCDVCSRSRAPSSRAMATGAREIVLTAQCAFPQ
jgi:dynactin-4